MEEETVFHTIPLARGKLTAFLIISLAFLAVSVYGSVRPEHISRLSNTLIIRILGIVSALAFGGIACVFYILLFVRRRAIEITDKGLREFTLFSAIFYPWPEIESVGIGEIPWGGGTLRYVGLSLREPEKFLADKPRRALSMYKALKKKEQPYHVIFTKGWTSVQPESLLPTLAAFFAEFTAENADLPPDLPKS